MPAPDKRAFIDELSLALHTIARRHPQLPIIDQVEVATTLIYSYYVGRRPEHESSVARYMTTALGDARKELLQAGNERPPDGNIH